VNTIHAIQNVGNTTGRSIEVLKQRMNTMAEVDGTRMWANAQRDGHPAEYRWRPLFNAAKFG